MNALKEIEVKDSFLTLDESTIRCQEQTFSECTTAHYIKALVETCGCLPFQLKQTDEKVKYCKYSYVNKYYDTGSYMHIKTNGLCEKNCN